MKNKKEKDGWSLTLRKRENKQEFSNRANSATKVVVP